NDFIKWNTNQSYIALGTLLQTAAELRIDATPIEGFNRKAYDDILNLEEQNLTSSVICSLGYRSKTDKSQFSAKVRKSEKEIFEVI
ncbi:MAG: nitroreductase, partial [Lentimonas sp.]